MATIVQWLERQIVVLDGAGSSPVSRLFPVLPGRIFFYERLGGRYAS